MQAALDHVSSCLDKAGLQISVEKRIYLAFPGKARKPKSAQLMIGSNPIRRVCHQRYLGLRLIRETVGVTSLSRQLPRALPHRMHPAAFVPPFGESHRQSYCAWILLSWQNDYDMRLLLSHSHQYHRSCISKECTWPGSNSLWVRRGRLHLWPLC